MRAFVGLGSNVGDRLAHLQEAIDALRSEEGVDVVRVSPVYETDPVGPDQSDFLNAVAELETNIGPRELFQICKQIERDIGRVDRERWGPREIDLDVLLYGNDVMDDDDLKVPHPLMRVRPFVVVPLRDLDPSLADDIGADGVRRTDLQLI